MRVAGLTLAVALAVVSPVGVAPAPDPAVSAALALAAAAAARLPRLHSLLVSWKGDLVLERYFNGASAARPANIKSASKSIISALVGIAIADGLIKGLDQPIGDYFPELARDRDPRKQAITIEDLLTMRSGLESTSGRNYGAWVQSGNWVRYVLNQPIIDTPGTRIEYSTGTTHLLSAILTRATKTSTWEFAQARLARPLGFSLARWTQDPQGVYFGGNEMLMTPRQLMRVGELYVNGGRVPEDAGTAFAGKPLLPRTWIEQTRLPRGRSRWGSDREYGYGWWIRTLGGRDTFYAWGYGGQFTFVVPDLDLVVVTTSRSDVSRERRDHNDGIYGIVGELIVPAMATVNGKSDRR